jgi:ankyrin repeat protein
VVLLLLQSKYGDNIYERGEDYDTPLMRACARGQWSTVTELIAIGLGATSGALDDLDIYDTSIRQQADRADHSELAIAIAAGTLCHVVSYIICHVICLPSLS